MEGFEVDWLEGEMWVFCFVECMCGYFDDLGFSCYGGFVGWVEVGVFLVEEVVIIVLFYMFVDKFLRCWDEVYEVIF